MSEKAWDLGRFYFIFMLIRTYECKDSNAVFLPGKFHGIFHGQRNLSGCSP